MGTIQLSGEVQRLIDQEVAAGRAESPASLIEEAVLHLLDDADEEDELARVVAAGIADIEAGRFMTVSTSEDRKRLQESFMADVQDLLDTK